MSRDGSGTYSIPNTFTSGTTIVSDDVDANFSDLATAITASIAKDGQTTPTADLPMGGYKHTNVAAPTARTDYARAGGVQDGTYIWPTIGGTGDIITFTTTFGPTAYTAGQTLRFKAAAANTGAVTVNWNSLGAKSLKTPTGGALAANDLVSGQIYTCTYDGTNFILANPVPSLTGTYVLDTGDTMTGALVMSGAGIRQARAANVASAATINLSALAGNFVHVTGTTSITAVTLTDGQQVAVTFDGALTLTHGASLILPGSANITTAAGDIAFFVGDASSVSRCIGYSRASSLVTASGLTQSTSRILGRTTASAGAVEEITAGTGLSLASGNLSSAANVLGTATALSGTSVSYTGLPSTIKKLTVSVYDMSTNGTSVPIIQLGSGSTVWATSSYAGNLFQSVGGSNTNISTGFSLYNAPSMTAAHIFHGSITLTNITGNVWVGSGAFGLSDTAAAVVIAGSIALADVLTAVRITTTGGTDTFDAGYINICYEV